MNPAEFQDKWRRAELTERSAAQQHFLDLCELLDHPKPADVDPRGDLFTFEKGPIGKTKRVLEKSRRDPPLFRRFAEQLFAAMAEGGYVGLEEIRQHSTQKGPHLRARHRLELSARSRPGFNYT